jgi:hypothetical protein
MQVDPDSSLFQNAYRKPLVILKNHTEAACKKLILAHFPCSQLEVGTKEHRPITEKEILRRVSISIFKISK